MMTPIEAMVLAYRAEGNLWFLSADRMNRRAKLCRRKEHIILDEYSYDVLAEYDDKEAAGHALETMRHDAAMRAAVRVLADNVPVEIARAHEGWAMALREIAKSDANITASA